MSKKKDFLAQIADAPIAKMAKRAIVDFLDEECAPTASFSPSAAIKLRKRLESCILSATGLEGYVPSGDPYLDEMKIGTRTIAEQLDQEISECRDKDVAARLRMLTESLYSLAAAQYMRQHRRK